MLYGCIFPGGGAIRNVYGTYAERTLTLSAGKRFDVGSFGLSAGGNINYFSLDAHTNNSGLGLDAGFLLETPGILPELIEYSSDSDVYDISSAGGG